MILNLSRILHPHFSPSDSIRTISSLFVSDNALHISIISLVSISATSHRHLSMCQFTIHIDACQCIFIEFLLIRKGSCSSHDPSKSFLMMPLYSYFIFFFQIIQHAVLNHSFQLHSPNYYPRCNSLFLCKLEHASL